jgi:hypothetical protein
MTYLTSEYSVFKKNSFLPLEIEQKKIECITPLSYGKKIVIWGSGHLGKVIYRLLERTSYCHLITGFGDSNPALEGKFILGKPVLNSSDIFESCLKRNSIIIISNATHFRDIKKFFEDKGLVEKENFISFLNIPRPEAVIQLVKNEQEKKSIPNELGPDQRTILNLNDYIAILDKLLNDIPLLSHVDLSGFSEPLLNPYLSEIVKYTEKRVPCTITTKLNSSIDNIQAILDSRPSQFLILANGFNKSFDENNNPHTWYNFKKKLVRICELKKTYEKYTEFRVNYIIYKNNSSIDLASMKELCLKLNIKLVTSIGYMNYYDDTLNLFDGKSLSIAGNKSYENLNWSLPKAMKFASLDRNQRCLCQRIFPIINFDKSVGVCHLYQKPILDVNILDVDYRKLLEKRSNSEHCKKCQSYALHRLDIDVLKARHGDYRDI